MTGKKLAFKFSTYIFEYRQLPPYVHLTSTHVMNTPRASPFFAGLPLPCIIVNANEGKNRRGLGTRLPSTFQEEIVQHFCTSEEFWAAQSDWLIWQCSNGWTCALFWLLGSYPPTSTSRPHDVIHVMNAPRPSPF